MCLLRARGASRRMTGCTGAYYGDPPLRLTARFVLVDAEGDKVLDSHEHEVPARIVSWTARDSAGSFRSSPGTYTLRVRITDEAGNARSIRREVTVSAGLAGRAGVDGDDPRRPRPIPGKLARCTTRRAWAVARSADRCRAIASPVASASGSRAASGTPPSRTSRPGRRSTGSRRPLPGDRHGGPDHARGHGCRHLWGVSDPATPRRRHHGCSRPGLLPVRLGRPASDGVGGLDERPERLHIGSFTVEYRYYVPVADEDQPALLIMPAPTVTPVASSMRMNEPVVRFLE